jgi:hypothetical protein
MMTLERTSPASGANAIALLLVTPTTLITLDEGAEIFIRYLWPF